MMDEGGWNGGLGFIETMIELVRCVLLSFHINGSSCLWLLQFKTCQKSFCIMLRCSNVYN